VREEGENILGFKKRKKEHGTWVEIIKRKQIKENINST